MVTLTVVTLESPAVFEHGLGRLLGVVEGIVLLPEVVLQNTDSGTEPGERLAVIALSHSEALDQKLGQANGVGIGGVHRRQPLGQQRDFALTVDRSKVRLELLFQKNKRGLAAGRVQQHENVVPAAVFRNIGEITDDGLGLVGSKPAKQGPENTALAESAADIPAVEENLHGEIRVLRIGTEETLGNLFIALTAQRADGCKKIQAVPAGGAEGDGAVFGISLISFFFQEFQHGKASFFC